MNDDVVIHATELRYWVLLVLSLSLGLLLIRWFDRLEGEALHRAVRRMGGCCSLPCKSGIKL